MLNKYNYECLRSKIKVWLNSYMERDFSAEPELFKKMYHQLNHNKPLNITEKQILNQLSDFEKIYTVLDGNEQKAYKGIKSAYWYKLASLNVSTMHVVDYYASRFIFKEDYMIYDDFEKAKANFYLWKYFVSELIKQFPEVVSEIYKSADKAYFSSPDYTERDKLLKEKWHNNPSSKEKFDLKIKIAERKAIKEAKSKSLRGGLSLEEFNNLHPDKQRHRKKMQKRYNSAKRIGTELKGSIGDIQNVAKIVLDFLKRKEQEKAYDLKKINKKKKYDSNPDVIERKKAKVERWTRVYESYSSGKTKTEIAEKEDITWAQVNNIIKDIKSGKKNLDEDYDPYNVLGEK